MGQQHWTEGRQRWGREAALVPLLVLVLPVQGAVGVGQRSRRPALLGRRRRK